MLSNSIYYWHEVSVRRHPYQCSLVSVEMGDCALTLSFASVCILWKFATFIPVLSIRGDFQMIDKAMPSMNSSSSSVLLGDMMIARMRKVASEKAAS
jgi:hypothetical protein